MGRPSISSNAERDCLPPEQDINDLVKFLRSIKAPKFPERSPDPFLFAQGRRVFKENCSSCHTLKGRARRVLSNDEVTLFVEDLNPLKDLVNATNACRALTSLWQEDHLWAEFSSQVYKDRAAAHGKGYSGSHTDHIQNPTCLKKPLASFGERVCKA
jgi:hypothetical protein